MTDTHVAAAPVPRIGRVTLEEVRRSLVAGVDDFRRAPGWGTAFAAPYVLAGLGLFWLGAGTFVWTLALALGFPLIAPFAAVGLYEVSRRLEAGEPLVRSEIIGLVWQERGRQLPWMGFLLMLIFLFWSFFAHLTFALFLGLGALGRGPLDLSALTSTSGLVMLAAQLVVGAATAFLAFGVAAVSLPLLLEKEIDIVTAMRVSLATVAQNKLPMAVWALIIAVSLFVSMLPAFLGLFVTLPVLGHATWHLYRRALYDPL